MPFFNLWLLAESFLAINGHQAIRGRHCFHGFGAYPAVSGQTAPNKQSGGVMQYIKGHLTGFPGDTDSVFDLPGVDPTDGSLGVVANRPISSAASNSDRGSDRNPGDTSTSGTTTVATGSSSTSPFVINITWDASVSSAPAGFTAGVQAAVQYLESQFSDPVTINIAVGYGEVNGSAMGSGALGESATWLNSFSYSRLTSALASDAKTSVDKGVVASLPSSVSGTFWASTAEAKALGLAAGNGTALDGAVGFSSIYGFDYNDADGVSGYDFNGTVLHEITEVMGRALFVGGSIDGSSPSYDAADLMHGIPAPGVHTFTRGGYFSVDGGVTDLGDFNAGGGDPGDWASSVANDSFDASATPGVINAVTANDLTLMDAIGWDPAGSVAPLSPPPPPPPPSPPSPVTITGTAGNDTINVAQIVTTGPATPTFIYGLAGNDTINATGMTGAMSATGGAGADKMTGGSGPNSYLFAAVGDSTSFSMDVVTNFHAMDVLDFRGLGSALTYGGNIPAAHGNSKKSAQPTIAAHSVDWQQSAGNTFVYVNTSGSSESLTNADMKVELLGSVSLTNSNVVHL